MVCYKYKFYIANQRPEMSDLNRFVTEYCTLWRPIGLKLGLKNSLLKLIAGEHPMQFRECFIRTLQQWLDQDMNATWSTLELAISNAHRDELSLDNLMESEIVCSVHLCISVYSYQYS